MDTKRQTPLRGFATVIELKGEKTTIVRGSLAGLEKAYRTITRASDFAVMKVHKVEIWALGKAGEIHPGEENSPAFIISQLETEGSRV